MTKETDDEAEAGPDKAASAEPEDGVAVPVRRRGRVVSRTPGGSSPVLVVALVMAAGAIVGLVLTFMKDNTIYVKPADELVKNQAKFVGRSVRVEGNLVHGSLVHHESPCEYTFTITKNDVNVPVKYEGCVVPDTFRDVPGMDVGVTVQGELQKDGTFEANEVLAKCPSKYEMKQKQAQGEQMPHAPVDGKQPGY
jgi:cytochrome c-type biogenesis protein CcmE